jgi:hypothetical protein
MGIISTMSLYRERTRYARRRCTMMASDKHRAIEMLALCSFKALIFPFKRDPTTKNASYLEREVVNMRDALICLLYLFLVFPLIEKADTFCNNRIDGTLEWLQFRGVEELGSSSAIVLFIDDWAKIAQR